MWLGNKFSSTRSKKAQMTKFGPKIEGHPSVGKECPACHKAFKVGDVTTIIPLGPGDDPEKQEKARIGKFYNAVALEVHWSCATGEIS